MDKSVAYQKLESLVARFTNHYDEYKVKSYNETQVRQDFINPFFEIFNWDTGNIQNLSESAREVVHEDKVKVLEKRIQRTKAPDYSFNLEGKRLFFVEAKKPSVFIKEECEPAYQLRRYAWSAKLKISILTDFEEFAVYDCLKKPNEKDKSSYARIKYIHYTEYLAEFDYLWEVFEKNNVLNGSLNKYFLDASSKKGIESVDDDFLNTLDGFRTTLASDISKQNMDMLERDINIVVQKTIDRIIFLRIAEDRDIEEYGKLNGVLVGDDYYQNLYNIFDDADRKYNSGLFENDELSRDAVVSNKVVKNIISDLYFPKSPYEFSVLSVEILGSAYEQFLGKTITLDKNHKSKIEYKPEVRKAGGVYYTPEYIVKYIVLNTLGALIKNKTPKQIESIKIVDPSCGSGSFLIGAYEYLLNFHETYYLNNPPSVGHKKESPIGDDNKLTVQTKKRILVNNIFGVDIDAQAVEVTKLSLMLKCLEGENSFSINEELGLFGERALPSMEDNIKCGNSLIGTDFYDSSGELDFGDSEIIYKINAFDWEAEFPSVFAQNGFDVVIGNPPYVKIQTLTESNPLIVDDLKERYFSARNRNIDLYVCFVEKGLSIIKENGVLGYILPHKFFEGDMGENLRSIISKKKALEKVVYFGANQVFENATTYTCLLFLSGKEKKEFELLRVYEETDLKKLLQEASFDKLPSSVATSEPWNFHRVEILNILDKLKLMPTKLNDITRKIFVGLQTSADDIYVLQGGEEKDGIVKTYSKSLDKEIEIERSIVKPFLMGKDIKKYITSVPNRWVIFPYIINNDTATLYTEKEIKSNFPLAWEYLSENKKFLENRERGKFKSNWWQYGRTQNLTEFEVDKISFPYMADKCQSTWDAEYCYHTTKVYSISFNEKNKYNPLFILGLLNSPLFLFFVKSVGTVFRGWFYIFTPNFIENFPIPELDLNNQSDKAKHDELVKLVTVMIDLNKKLKVAGNQVDEKSIVRIIEATDRKIDSLVYSLYNLSEGEIKVVEGN